MTHPNIANAAEILAQQRAAFLHTEPPDLKQRKAQLAKLRRAVLEYRSVLAEAASADFGHRSHHETDVMELVGIIQSIDYLSRNLRRFIKLEKRKAFSTRGAGISPVYYVHRLASLWG